MKEVMSRLALAAAVPLWVTATAWAQVEINEVRQDMGGADNDEYFELAGPAATSLNDLTYIVLGDDATLGSSGVIEAVVPLTGQSIPASGFFVAAEGTFSLGLPNLVTVLNFENGNNVTHLLVQNFTGLDGDDLDTNDDGVLDITPWSAIIDCIALIGTGTPGVDDSFAYCTDTVGPDGAFVAPHAYKCDPDGTWTLGEFDLTDPGATDTPGAINTACNFEPPCGADLAGDCFVANGTGFCDDLACCTLIIDNFNPACAIVWDQTCADLALINCRACGDPNAGDCFTANGTPYCNITFCCDTVCALNAACCSISGWDQTCADLATANCVINTVQQGDLVMGHSDGNGDLTLDLARGPAALNGGVNIADAWTEPFIQHVQLDNLGGLLHNPAGNLLAVNFGPAGFGGTIYNMSACQALGAGQLIGDTQGLGGAGLTASRLTGISVSPDNTKIALVGYDSMEVIVYDYVAGDCLGGGASLSGGRQTAVAPLCAGDTQGTAWLDNNTVLAYSSNGFLYTVDATTMMATPVALLPGNCPSATTMVEYNPAISPLIFCMNGTFAGGTTNTLTVLDTAFTILGTFDYSTSIDTARDIALDRSGNLYVSMFGGTVDVILDAITLASLVDNVSLDWYIPPDGSGFNAIDIATASAFGNPCPYDCGMPSNGMVGTEDFLELLAQWAMVGTSCDPDNDGVDTADFLNLLAAWGLCP